MFDVIDNMTAAFLSALQSGFNVLRVFSLAILGTCAVISFYREYSTTVMSSGAGTGDALAHALLLIFATGCYMLFLDRLWDLSTWALEGVFNWGLLGSGGGVTAAQLRAPSFILAAGFKTARPIADFDTWIRGVRSVFKLLDHPGDLIAFVLILVSFTAITAHHLMMLVEYYLAVMFATVLVPWGIWRVTSGVAEFSLGWLTGSLIRALVSTAMIGIATPSFALLNQPLPGAGFLSMTQSFVLAAAAFVYLVLCWQIPANAARMAGSATLGLTGNALAAAAMTTARFGLMVQGMGSAATRALSPMLRRG